MNLPRWLLVALVIVITAVWVTSFVAGLKDDNYKPPESINLVFAAMVTALLSQLARKDEDGDDEDGPQ